VSFELVALLTVFIPCGLGLGAILAWCVCELIERKPHHRGDAEPLRVVRGDEDRA
jgi:hypothetical protein